MVLGRVQLERSQLGIYPLTYIKWVTGNIHQLQGMGPDNEIQATKVPEITGMSIKILWKY